MHWIVIALLAPALWAAGNHIDKYLLATRFNRRGVGSLMLFSALIGLPAMLLVFIINPRVLQIPLLDGAIITLNGVLYVLGLLPYLYALQKDEASIVVPLFQTSAVFSYALGLLVLGEQLTWWQIGAALLIVCGSIAVTLEFDQRRSRIKLAVFGLMLLASLLNALNWLLFKFVATRADFWVTSFWEYAGFTLAGLVMLLFVRAYRAEFVSVLKGSRLDVIGLVGINELLSLTAKTATNIASLLAPLALISTVHGLQPLFVLIYSVLLTRYLPRYGSERLTPAIIVQKVGSIALMIVGTSLLAAS